MAELKAEPEQVAESDISFPVKGLSTPAPLPESMAELEVEPDPEAESVTSSDVATWPTQASLVEIVIELEPKPQLDVKAQPSAASASERVAELSIYPEPAQTTPPHPKKGPELSA